MKQKTYAATVHGVATKVKASSKAAAHAKLNQIDCMLRRSDVHLVKNNFQESENKFGSYL